MNEGFNLVYAKIGGSPKNIFFQTKLETEIFLKENINKMDFLSINDVNINIEQLKKIYTKENELL